MAVGDVEVMVVLWRNFASLPCVVANGELEAAVFEAWIADELWVAAGELLADVVA